MTPRKRLRKAFLGEIDINGKAIKCWFQDGSIRFRRKFNRSVYSIKILDLFMGIDPVKEPLQHEFDFVVKQPDIEADFPIVIRGEKGNNAEEDARQSCQGSEQTPPEGGTPESVCLRADG